MNYREYWRTSRGGIKQFACEWLPENVDVPKGVVGLVHGMGEHMGRYAHVANMLADEGYAVVGFDQLGHGLTEGKRGHTPSYDALLESIDAMLADITQRYEGVPAFLYGHSMGGNVTLNYLLRRKPLLHGAIVSSPWLRLAFDPPPLPLVAGRMLERIYPRFTNDRPISTERLTTDLEMAERIRTDKLGHGVITAKFFFGVRRAGVWAIQHAHNLSIPVLLMHGGDDKVTSIQASRQFAKNAGDRCLFLEWPGYKHELHNEKEREAVFAFIRRWLAEKTSNEVKRPQSNES